MQVNPIRFVADGWERLRRDPEFKAQQKEIEAAIRARYSTTLTGAKGFWARRRIEKQIQTEVRHELKKIGSPHCLWIARPF